MICYDSTPALRLQGLSTSTGQSRVFLVYRPCYIYINTCVKGLYKVCCSIDHENKKITSFTW